MYIGHIKANAVLKSFGFVIACKCISCFYNVVWAIPCNSYYRYRSRQSLFALLEDVQEPKKWVKHSVSATQKWLRSIRYTYHDNLKQMTGSIIFPYISHYNKVCWETSGPIPRKFTVIGRKRKLSQYRSNWRWKEKHVMRIAYVMKCNATITRK